MTLQIILFPTISCVCHESFHALLYNQYLLLGHEALNDFYFRHLNRHGFTPGLPGPVTVMNYLEV